MPQAVLQGFKLSPQQRRAWTLRAAPGAGWVQAAWSLSGPLDGERLRGALARVAARHGALRTLFAGAGVLSMPLQAVEGEGLELAVREPVEGGLAATIAAVFAADPARPLDPERGPLAFATLVGLGEERSLVCLSLPALLADSASLAVLFETLAAEYGGDSVAEEPLQYLEFCEWQNELLEGEEGREGRAFWAKRELPAREERLGWGSRVEDAAELERFAPGVFELPEDSALAADLDRAVAALDASPRVLLLSAWGALLSRYLAAERVVIGATYDGRKFEDLAGGIGPFARTLPVALRCAEGLSFAGLARQVAAQDRELAHWQELAPWDLGFETEAPRRVFPFAFDFETWPGERRAARVVFRCEEQQCMPEPFQVGLACRPRKGHLGLRLAFDAAELGAAQAAELGASYLALLRDALRRPDTPLDELEVLPEAARQRLVIDFNRQGEATPARLLLHERFAAQASLYPEAPAVVDEQRSLSYGELDRLSSALAERLRALGAGPEVRVALWLDRSVELIVALLAVLRSGAAYVPLDLSFPRERLALLLAGSGAALVVTRASLVSDLPEMPARVVAMDGEPDEGASNGAGSLPAVLPESLAYVLFTSGSTGLPKGVAVEHRQVVSYLEAILARLELEPGWSYATVSTFAADLGNTVIFPALATGGCLHVVGHEEARNPEALAARFAKHPIDVLKIVPTHLEALLAVVPAERLLPRRRLIVGGEAASAGLVAELRRAAEGGLKVWNHYGPTETTVGAMVYRVAPEPADGLGEPLRLPLGSPLPNAQVFLLDRGLRPVSVGMPGEIFIGGDGISRGYLGRPDLTAERFVPSPFGPAGGRLYRTGDLARFRTDGLVELIGRADHQIKLRGYRIELGEIEATLRRHPDVRDAAVVLREERTGESADRGERRLAAYVVPRRTGAALATVELRAFAACWLPEAMIPSAFVLLEALPLTANGKVDRAALPAPERQGRESVEPRDEVEAALAAIWSQVLGVERVGVHDNFFELGGDSILVIQVVARAGRMGLGLQPRQMFERQTIAELAAVATRAAGSEAAVAAQPAIEEAPLTPIQHWFFAQQFADPEHWNQGALYEVPPEVAPEVLRDAFAAVYAHHDALRLRFVETPGGIRQRVGGVEPLPFDVVDLPGREDATAMAELVAGAQASLNLARGPLVRALFLHGGGERASRLLLVFHHLAIDGVSWRILIEDFVTAFQAVAAGSVPILPTATTPFLRWAETLQAWTEGGGCDDELAHWESCGSALIPLPRDVEEGEDGIAAELSVARSLSAAETSALLQEAPAAHRAQIHEVLLAALARVLCRWAERRQVTVDLEGHGREDLFAGVDLTRTVGWFTTHFPLVLEAERDAPVAEVLVAVKGAVRAVPRRGIGFGCLRYLRGGDGAERLRLVPQPEISFNYLGQFERPEGEATLFARAAESAGPLRSPRGHRTHLLAVVCRVDGGVFEVAWRYGANRHRRPTIERLADDFLGELRSLIDARLSPQAADPSPADFDLAAGLSREQLERIAQLVGQAKS
jgi:amino acid adenylation domain-containing protein/non-ribosomal peptide synthase protein (TIGR01720 family)